MNYVFLDTECVSKSTTWNCITEIAAVIVNDEFQELDDPINLRSRIRPGICVQPEALLVNRTTPKMLLNTNLSNYQMMNLFLEKVKRWTPAIFIGYNSHGYDFPVIQKTLFRQLHEPYITQFSGNKNADLLGIVRAAHLFFPNSIKTPKSEKGNAVFKLDQLTILNGIKHESHQALTDCYGAIEIAKIIKKNAPEVWENSKITCSKNEVNNLIEDKRVFSTAEYYYGRSHPFLCAFICKNSYNFSMSFDLKHDPMIYFKMSYQQLKEQLRQSPKIVRTCRSNKHPIIMGLEHSLQFDNYRQLGREKLLARAKLINDNTEFRERVFNILQEEIDEKKQLDSQLMVLPEESLYSGTFPNEFDKKIMAEFHASDWDVKLQLSDKFKDSRYSYFAKRLIYEENPSTLPEEEFRLIHRKIAEQILSKNEEPWTTVYKAYTEIDDLRAKYEETGDKEKLKMLDEINDFIMDIEKKFENA